MKKLLALSLLTSSLLANVAVTGDDYMLSQTEGISMIYAKEHQALSQQVLAKEQEILSAYHDSFGYMLDDRQYVGLLSSHNQVANGFSSQTPINRQINFGGGALMPDYFSTTSWIETLLWHESAHNFQLNPKKNLLSYYAHKLFKNSFMTSIPFLGVPIFPVPNRAESSFVLEGNAVLNESWHNNGGRLYNGAMLAMTITQAQAGYITPERTYNEHLYFPYGTHHYIVGGFFQLFLAKKFGIDRVNHYFYNFSGQWIPIFTNAVFKETYGEDFEHLLAKYRDDLLERYRDFHTSKGTEILRSKVFYRLNGDEKEIYFLTSDMLSKPHLIRYDKKSEKIEQTAGNFKGGRLFKEDGKFYTLCSAHTSAESIMIGLYDEEGRLLKKSASKIVQSLTSKSMSYFDVASSFDQPRYFVDGEFYAQVNSSVFRDKSGNHYYCVQKGKTRTLYKNHTPLYSWQGYYGFVTDVEDGSIYLIANSALGTGLYRYHDSHIERMSEGDDILDAKLLDSSHALVSTIDADGISYKKILLFPEASTIHEVRYFFEKEARFDTPKRAKLDTPSSVYHPEREMHYSALDQSFTINQNSEVDFAVSANFTDALSQNSFKIFSYKANKEITAGVGYDSSAYRLNFGGSIFKTLQSEEKISSRGYGSYLYAAYPLWQESYQKLALKLSYLLEDDRAKKMPLVATLGYTDHKHFGRSMYLNEANDFTLSVGLDRSDRAVGVGYLYAKDFSHQWYSSFHLKAAISEVKNSEKKRGILLQQYGSKFSNALNITMASLPEDRYVKHVANAGIRLRKVFDGSKYFFTFPISLRREALYGEYDYFNLELLNNQNREYHQMTVGVSADLLFFNSMSVPLSVEYIYNDKLPDANHVRVLFDLDL